MKLTVSYVIIAFLFCPYLLIHTLEFNRSRPSFDPPQLPINTSALEKLSQQFMQELDKTIHGAINNGARDVAYYAIPVTGLVAGVALCLHASMSKDAGLNKKTVVKGGTGIILTAASVSMILYPWLFGQEHHDE